MARVAIDLDEPMTGKSQSSSDIDADEEEYISNDEYDGLNRRFNMKNKNK